LPKKEPTATMAATQRRARPGPSAKRPAATRMPKIEATTMTSSKPRR
jgi:hypothetical protein